MELLSENGGTKRTGNLGRLEIEAVRERLLKLMMYALMAIGFPAVIAGATQAYQQGQWQFSLIYICTYTVVLVCTIFPRRIPFAFRVHLLLLMNYAIAVAILLRIGLSGSGIVLLMAFCTIVAVMFGARYGLIAIGLSILTIASVGTGMITGFIPINIKNMLNSTSVLAWITYGFAFTMVTALMVIAPNMFQDQLINSMDRLQLHAEELERINQKLRREMQYREEAEQALRESEEKYRDLVENVNDIIFTVDTAGVITYVNPVVSRYGYRPEDLVGTVGADFVHTEDRERIARRLNCALRGVSETGVFRFLTKDGEVRWATFDESVIREGGAVKGLRGVLNDVTDRIQAEELIKTSLREKEVMLQEIHHRVKNNMQIISSLLSLQTKSVTDERDIELFSDTVYRVRSMALIHEKLYQSDDLASIDLIEYIRSLANELFASYQINTNQVELSIEGERVQLGVNIAIPCALIINELISNALKYAFPDDRKGTIEVSIRIDDAMNCSISVADDGVGIQDNIDIESSETLGLQLVKVLIRQLNGTVQLEHEKGTRFLLCFPVTERAG